MIEDFQLFRAVERTFRKFDRDGSGLLDKMELMAAFSSMVRFGTLREAPGDDSL